VEVGEVGDTEAGGAVEPQHDVVAQEQPVGLDPEGVERHEERRDGERGEPAADPAPGALV
jgi:hypothetical protein